MKKLAILVLALTPHILLAQQHHPQARVIDGSQHPEQIPDTIAYRMYLLSLSVPANADAHRLEVQAARVDTLHLDVNDYGHLLDIVQTFRAKHDSIVDRWNSQARALKDKFNPANLLNEQDDLVAQTQRDLHTLLSTQGFINVANTVQNEKRNIQLIQ